MNTMKSAKLLLLVLGLALFTHCSKDSSNDPIDSKPDDHSQEEPAPKEPEVYYSYTTDDDWPLHAQRWLIIHDTAGKLLDYAQEQPGGTTEFKAALDTLNGPLTVTELEARDRMISKPDPPYDPVTYITYTFKSNMGISIGTQISPTPYSPSNRPEVTGNFMFSLKNIPTEYPNGWALVNVSQDGTKDIASGGTDESSLSKTLNTYEGRKDLLTTVWNGVDAWEYTFLENFDSTGVALDFNTDFKPLDDAITQPLPENESNFTLS